VRNKKRVGYTYEITIDVKGWYFVITIIQIIRLFSSALITSLMGTGEWLVGDEKKRLKGHLDIAEFSYGELDELEVCCKSWIIVGLHVCVEFFKVYIDVSLLFEV